MMAPLSAALLLAAALALLAPPTAGVTYGICGAATAANLSRPTGALQSSAAGTAYGAKLSCAKTIVAPAGQIVALTFSAFRTRGYGDFVYAYDDRSAVGARRVGRWYRGYAPGEVRSMGRALHVLFR